VFLTALRLTDFRSYQTAELALSPGVTLFLGLNGQGKTNLVEAVEYVATLNSHRVASDQPLVRRGCQQAVIQARLRAGRDDERALAVDLEINLGRPNKARLNKAPVRPRAVVGALRTVTFAPEDLTIATGDPSNRRAFIDALCTTRWPRLTGVRADYDRALRQRTALLKALSGRGPRPAGPEAETTLAVWDERLAVLGAEIVAARLQTVADLAPRFTARYSAIAPIDHQAVVTYLSHAVPEWGRESGPWAVDQLAERYLAEIERRRPDELARGQSLVGPHRDDLELTLADLPVKGYASHGESWSVALGLRLASLDLLRADDIEPVLLLDDVFAELDTTRRQRLAETVAQTDQVLITAAVPEDVPWGLVSQTFTVSLGSVRPVDGDQGQTGNPVATGEMASVGDGEPEVLAETLVEPDPADSVAPLTQDQEITEVRGD
jgi:DNA replication and repair protein RecF